MAKYTVDITDKKLIYNKNDFSSFPYVVVYRIIAAEYFYTITGREVKAGEKGGYIQTSKNLDNSNQNKCWVTDNAVVYGNAVVTDNACVSDNACVFGSILVSEDCVVENNSVVCENVTLKGKVRVSGSSIIKGDTYISGTVDIFGFSYIYSNMCKLTKHRERINIWNCRYHSDLRLTFDSAIIGSEKDFYIGEINLKEDSESLEPTGTEYSALITAYNKINYSIVNFSGEKKFSQVKTIMSCAEINGKNYLDYEKQLNSKQVKYIKAKIKDIKEAYKGKKKNVVKNIFTSKEV